MRSIYLLGKDTADEWRMMEPLGGAPNAFFRATQRIAFGVTQPDLLRIDVVDTARKLVSSHGSAFPAHLVAAWVWRQRDPDRAERYLEAARALATSDHPYHFLLPSPAEWQVEPVAQRLVEIHPGRMWRVEHRFSMVGSPLHASSIATIIKLSNGDVAIINPIAFDDHVAAAIEQLGTVRWLITQGKAHSMFVEPTRRRFRGSLAIATKGHLRHPPAHHLTIDGVLDTSKLPDDLATISIDGHLLEEVILVDRPTKTMIVQDLFFLNGATSPFLTRLYNFACGLVEPIGYLNFSLMMFQKLPAFHASLGKLRDVEVSHVLGAHGTVIPRDGDVAAMRSLIDHTRGISPFAHKAMLARFFTAQPMFLRDLVRYLRATKGKPGARLRESTAAD